MSTVKDLLDNIRPQKKIIVGELENKEFENVLEVGCQWGENLKAIREKFPTKELVGVDKNQLELNKVISLLPDIKFICADANQLPFDNESFDVVFTNALFCMLPSREVKGVLNEIIRVAKKYIYLVELNTISFIEIIDKDRVGANWEMLFRARGFKTNKRKIVEEEWDCLPWRPYGYLIFVDKNERISPIL